MAQRSFHPEEVTQQKLIPDSRYYLQHQARERFPDLPDTSVGIQTFVFCSLQVHAVVTRLCQPIEGLDAAQLASWLGLDPSAYSQRQTGGGEEEGADYLLSTDGLALVEGEPLILRCRKEKCSALTSLGPEDNVCVA